MIDTSTHYIQQQTLLFIEQDLISNGKCIFCNGLFDQDEIGKHLAKHLSQKEKEDIGRTTSTFYHIIIGGNALFLHILVRGDSKMKTIDNFLRSIWLECCGHLSNFGYKKFNILMSETVAKVFAGKIKIFHDYDYGSTTQVDLKGGKSYALHLKENLLLLSRNEPLKLMC